MMVYSEHGVKNLANLTATVSHPRAGTLITA